MGKPSKNESWERYYIQCIVPTHPFKNKRNLVFEHRLVMEQWLREHEPNHPALIEMDGVKYLRKGWVVHHKNGKKSDNRIKNLKVMTNREHIRLHQLAEKNSRWNGGKSKKKGKLLILCKNHPFCDTNGYLFEHRLIMENYLKKYETDHPALFDFKGELYLKKEAIVQNMSKNKTDNRIENLLLSFCGVAYTPRNQIFKGGKEKQIESFNEKNWQMHSENDKEWIEELVL